MHRSLIVLSSFVATAAAVTCDIGQPGNTGYDIYGTVSTPILKGEYCGQAHATNPGGCEGNIGGKIKNKWKQATGVDMSPSTLGTDTVDCICNSANSITDADAYISTGGVFVMTGAAGVAKVCASTACKAATMNADMGTTSNGWNMAYQCGLNGHDCTANGVTAIRDKLTECQCEAAAGGYHYYWGLDVTPTWQDFCSYQACSDVSNMWVAAGITSSGCAAAEAASNGAMIGGIIGGSVGGIFFLLWICDIIKKKNAAAAAKGGASHSSAAV